MRKRILFVDDEPKVLDGLRRMLHNMNEEWEIHFAISGSEALKMMEVKPFDVVVTDMRMPSMDGAQLLQEVTNKYPKTIRMILSGQADHESILRSIGPAHQYLAKPCDTSVLKQTIMRACALRELLANEYIRQLISHTKFLPSLPSLYSKLLQELKSSDTSIKMVAWIISQDIGMSAKILQIVNSVFFGINRRITDVAQAVTYLGLDIIKALVLSINIFSSFERIKMSNFSFESIWHHSLIVGTIAKKISKSEDLDIRDADEAFTAGLLHDIGKPILASNFKDEYIKVIDLVKKENLTFNEAEQIIFNTTHSEVGAYLLGLWGVPDQIVECLAFHHQPTRCLRLGLSPMLAIHIADFFAHKLTTTETSGRKLPHIDDGFIYKINLGEHISTWESISQNILTDGEKNEQKSSFC